MHALTESGSALNDGELTLSADGQDLVATGYDAGTGVASITSATEPCSPTPCTGPPYPRSVALVTQTGVLDTSTSLTDATTESQNFRSATQATGGNTENIYTGGGGGTGITPDGGTSAAYFNADKVHEVQVLNGHLYESTTNSIDQVGSGLPTSGTQTDTVLLGTGEGQSPPLQSRPVRLREPGHRARARYPLRG